MTRQQWKDIFEVVGTTGVIVSLIFVGLQMREEHRVSQADLFASFGSTHTRWIGLLNGHIDVWVDGLDGTELSHKDNARFDGLARGYIVLQRTKYMRSTRVSTATPESIALDVANFIYSHPGFSDWYAQWRKYYQQRKDYGQFEIHVDTYLDELVAGTREPVTLNSYIPNN